MVPSEDVLISKIVSLFTSSRTTVAFSRGFPSESRTVTSKLYFLKNVPGVSLQVKFHVVDLTFIVEPFIVGEENPNPFLMFIVSSLLPIRFACTVSFEMIIST